MSSINYLAKNTILFTAAKTLSHVIAFLILPIYTATLKPSEYGLIDMIITYTALLGPLLLLNVHAALFRFLVDARDNVVRQRQIVTSAVDCMIVGVAVVTPGVVLLGTICGGSLLLTASVALYFVSFMVSEVVSQVVRGLGNNRLFAVTAIIQSVLSAVLSVVALLLLNMRAEGVFVALAIGLIVPSIYAAGALNMHKMYDRQLRSAVVRRNLLRYALPLVPNSVSWWVFNASDRTILLVLISATANGIYAVSNKFSGVLYNLWGMFYMPLTESVALAIDKKDRDHFLSTVFSSIIRVFGVIAALGISATALAFPLLVASEFSEARQYIPLLILAGYCNCIVGFYSAIYIAKKLTREVMWVSITAATINLSVILLLIGWLQIWAAAISTLLAFFVTAVHRHVDIKRRGFQIAIDVSTLLGIGFLLVVATTVYYIGSWWANLATLAIVGALGAVAVYDIAAYLKTNVFRLRRAS